LKRTSPNEQPATTEDGIDLVAASGIILRVIADWQQSEYTEDSSTENGRQVEVRQHNDLSNPASGVNTTQG
jgi:hypothetical protein